VSVQPLDDLAATIHRRVIDDDRPVALVAGELATLEAPLLPEAERKALVEDVLARVHGLGPLEDWLRDPDVTDLLVNGGSGVWVERHGRLEHVGRLAPGVTEQVIERVLAPLGLRVDRASPIVDARLPDGSRVHAVIPPLAVDGPSLAIRRFARRRVPLTDLTDSTVVADLLRELVATRTNVVVSGATSSGKTTLLNALATEIDPGERVITIEDAAELRLDTPHVVRLEARPASADGYGAASIRDLVRAALRMRPDRLVVGEVRGGEALDMVQAMNTGHDGSLTTCHANSAIDALRRIEAMVLQGAPALPLEAVREQVHASIDAVVHVIRGQHGRRRVAQIAEVLTEVGPDRVRLLADDARTLGALTRRRTAK
jgi:pilus assembly protein CpaF